MFDSSSIIVGLEIGTSKICAVVGEINPDSSGLNIVGLGQAKSRGVRKGEICDAPAVEEDIRNAIVEAEQMADVEIRSVYLGVTGGHVRGFNNRGVHPVVSADREISEDDVQDVIKNAKTINLPAAESCDSRDSPALSRGRPGRHFESRSACWARAWKWMCTWCTEI